jgi:hypothetical protein
MAAIAAVVTLFYAIFLFQGYTAFFRDSDAGWHIRTGELILRTGALPHTDPFSFTKGGQPWFAWEWLADVVMGAIHRTAGLSGLVLVYGLAIASCVWLWFRLNWDVGGHFLLACAFASLMLSTTNIHWLARPHVFSWIFFLVAVRSCESLNGPLSRIQMVAVAIVTVLWTNIHGSFFFAILIPLIWAGGNAVSRFLWQPDTTHHPSPVQPYLQCAVVAAFSTLLNPFGWQLHLHVARYLLDKDLLDRIGEFESFNFHADGAIPITLALAISMAGAVFCLATRRLPQSILSAILVFAALRSARGLPLVALLALPLANGAMTSSFAAASGLSLRMARFRDDFLSYGQRLRSLDSRNNGGFLVAGVCVLLALLLKAPGIAAATGFPKDQFPVAASPAVAALPSNARLFAPDKFGGYLIYKFNGTRKVFFDGRSDFYGAGFLKDYGRMVSVRPGWEALFDSYEFTHALLPHDSPLTGALVQRGWRQLYSDSTATLLVANKKAASFPAGLERIN